jgi:hypothetical protein
MKQIDMSKPGSISQQEKKDEELLVYKKQLVWHQDQPVAR